MFPQIFQSLYTYKNIFGNILLGLVCIWNDVYEIIMCKNIFGRNIYVRSKFSCVRSSHGLCVRTHAHSLEGTLFVRLLVPDSLAVITLDCQPVSW